jgi:hypothetical protein
MTVAALDRTGRSQPPRSVMRTTRLITAALTAALLGAAVVAGPAAAIPADTHNQPNGWYAGKSTIQGSKHSASPAAQDPAKANVYVPPASLWPGDQTTSSSPASEPRTQLSAAVEGTASGFDWGSAGIGAAAGIGAFAIALAGTAGLRRRRVASVDH